MRKTLLVLSSLFISFLQADAQCTVVAMASSNGPVCEGGTLQLSGTAGGGTWPYTYQWTGPAGFYDVMPSANIQNVSQVNAGVYMLIVIDANACADTAYMTVPVGTTPPPTVVTPVNYCEGTIAVPLTANGTNLLWYTTQVGGVGSTIAPTPFTAVPGTFTYYVSQTVNGCESQRSAIIVNILPVPVVTASNNGPICEGATMQVTVSPNYTMATYNWTGPNFFNSTFQNPSLGFTPLAAAGVYTVVVTLGGCASQPVSTTLVVNPLPPAVPPFSTDQVCEGGDLVDTCNNCIVTGPDITTGTGGMGLYNAQLSNNGTTYTVQYTDNNGCMSVYSGSIYVNPIPSITTTHNDPTTINSTDGSIVISGLTLATYVVNYAKNGVPQSPVSITASGGMIVLSSLGVGTYSNITVMLSGCVSNAAGPEILTATTLVVDSVWPGDVNYDLIANNTDVLDLALSYGQVGTARTGGSNSWIAQESIDWGTLQTNSMDTKHADCNGDGTVDINDTLAIYNNYGMTHQKGSHIPKAKVTANPDLYFDMTGIVLAAGTTVSIPIKLGTGALPMNNIMGMAAEVKVDGITLNIPPVISTVTSWLGNSTNTLNFTKSVSANQTDWAFTRIDHTNVSGDGAIATMTVAIPAGAVGQDAVFFFDNVKMIDNSGNVLTDYNVVDDTATVYPLSTAGVASVSENVSVVPNPSANAATLHVTTKAVSKVQVNVTDMLGRNIWSGNSELKPGVNNISLPSASILAGMYHVQLLNATTGSVQVIKWIKK